MRDKSENRLFDVITQYLYEDCIVYQVDIMRPDNAPKRKRTNSDIARTKIVNVANLVLDDRCSGFEPFEYLLWKYVKPELLKQCKEELRLLNKYL